MNDEFYIGWEDRMPPGLARSRRGVVVFLGVFIVFAALLLAMAQRMIGAAVFEYGARKQFTGIFRAWPYPHLLVPRPAGLWLPDAYSTYLLVAPWKYGLPSETLTKFDGKFVSLRGTLIYRDAQTMVEVAPMDIALDAGKTTRQPLPASTALGNWTLTGEIVDSKCFLGVMNPGELTPHRACATLCIRGGIPPIFLVRQRQGPPLYLLLVSRDGRPVNQQVLDFVAEPLEITGDVERRDGLLILRADPATYRRLP